MPMEDIREPNLKQAMLKAMQGLFQVFNSRYGGKYIIDTVKIKSQSEKSDDVFIIVTAWEKETGDPVVAFHDGYDVVDALRGLTGRYTSGKLKWRDDNYRDALGLDE